MKWAHPTRLETRRAVLSCLWCSKGAFRPDIVNSIGLTEASVNRIVAELKAEGVLDETKRAARYQGGTNAFFTLSQNITLGVIEISNGRIHFGVGTLFGDLRHSDRYDLPDGSLRADVERAVSRAVRDLRQWSSRRETEIEHFAVSIPGFHAGRTGNAIIALDPAFVGRTLERDFPNATVAFANSIVTRAVSHRLQLGTERTGGSYLHVFVGHGVGAAIVGELAESGSIQLMEIGHMVLNMNGPKCRCGHNGCLEAFASTTRVAEAVGIDESKILMGGDRWAQDTRFRTKAMRQVRQMLVQIGVAIGNTINIVPVSRVVVSGWPAAFAHDEWAFIEEGVGRSLFGSLPGLDVSVASEVMGQEPASGLALAAYTFLQRGGARQTAARDRDAQTNQTTGLIVA
jgi:predicted NBD/HSP70 family sugar kinase